MAGMQSTENMPGCWDRYFHNYLGRVQSQGETIPMHIEIESS